MSPWETCRRPCSNPGCFNRKSLLLICSLDREVYVSSQGLSRLGKKPSIKLIQPVQIRRATSITCEMNLYLNTHLTNSSAHAPTGIRPTFPSSGRNYLIKPTQSSHSAIDVFAMQLRSLAVLRPEKVKINLSLDPKLHSNRQYIWNLIESYFSGATTSFREDRPSTLKAWLDDSRSCIRFFGADAPVVCIFNHDHLFVDYSPTPFLSALKSLEIDPFAFLYYSHTPEQISIAANPVEYIKRLKLVSNWDLRLTNHQFIGHGLLSYIVDEWIDSIFATSPLSLEKLWSNASSSSSYIARPDWSGVSHFGQSFRVITSLRESFRHFDGYGHVSSLPSLMGNRSLYPQAMLKTELSKAKDQVNLDYMCEAYQTLFEENYLLAVRDHMLAWTVEGRRLNFRQKLSSVLKLFLNYYVYTDLATCDDDFRRVIVERLCSRVFAEEVRYYSLIEADVRIHLC
jgi:hypothetical protein